MLQKEFLKTNEIFWILSSRHRKNFSSDLIYDVIFRSKSSLKNTNKNLSLVEKSSLSHMVYIEKILDSWQRFIAIEAFLANPEGKSCQNLS